MLYILALIFPPAAVIMCGKPFQFILNIFLTLLFYLPGEIHALCVVSGHYRGSTLKNWLSLLELHGIGSSFPFPNRAPLGRDGNLRLEGAPAQATNPVDEFRAC